ncbi:MAG: hypothetical protein K9N07_01590 [Candidatus Cloacimonetes bacterium]|nr:hypothetical protein [Candidatus Cloacimonadota bacterium]
MADLKNRLKKRVINLIIKEIPNWVIVLSGGRFGCHFLLLGQLGGKDQSKELDTARENSIQVIWSTLRIEKSLEDVIIHFLFTIATGIDKERDFFINEIGRSSIISYNDKKKLALKIIENDKLLKGKERDKLIKDLSKIMKYRNALAHGSLEYSVNHGVLLRFYSGRNETIILNDEFLTTLEELYKNTNKTLTEINNKIIERKKTELVNTQSP